MKIILKKDVKGTGRAYEIKEVKEGYFRNFLMPRGLAEAATPEKTKELEEKKQKRARKIEETKSQTAAELQKVLGAKLILEAKATPEGHLYRGVGEKEILKKLRESGFKSAEREWILLEKPFKKIGEFEIEIKTPFREEGKIKIEIRPEN